MGYEYVVLFTEYSVVDTKDLNCMQIYVFIFMLL